VILRIRSSEPEAGEFYFQTPFFARNSRIVT
jgi:hypothetical protein